MEFVHKEMIVSSATHIAQEALSAVVNALQQELIGVAMLRYSSFYQVVDTSSDSKYVIDALSKGWVYGWQKKGWVKSDKKPALNVDLWERLLPLIAAHDVRYHWVKGHAENEYNNRCDELAVAESRKYK